MNEKHDCSATPSRSAPLEDVTIGLYNRRARGGGHGPGRGLPGKTEFPMSWSGERTMAAIGMTVDAPDVEVTIGNTVFSERHVDEVIVCAVWRRPPDSPSRMVTAYPIGGDGVGYNDHPDDEPTDLATAMSLAMPELLTGAPHDLVLRVRIAATVGEPYEAIHAGLRLAVDHSIALPQQHMIVIGLMIHQEYFDPADKDEVRELFNALADRDHPDAEGWGRL